jgi:hypothetical protein
MMVVSSRSSSRISILIFFTVVTSFQKCRGRAGFAHHVAWRVGTNKSRHVTIRYIASTDELGRGRMTRSPGTRPRGSGRRAPAPWRTRGTVLSTRQQPRRSGGCALRAATSPSVRAHSASAPAPSAALTTPPVHRAVSVSSAALEPVFAAPRDACLLLVTQLAGRRGPPPRPRRCSRETCEGRRLDRLSGTTWGYAFATAPTRRAATV